MKHKRKIGLVLVLILAALLLGGCGAQRGPIDPAAPAEGAWQALVVFPLTEALMFLNRLIDNAGIPYSYGWAIIVFTIIIKLVTLPLTIKQMQSTKAMQVLQPQLQELQKKYAKDRETLAQKQMEFYKEAGVSPMGGCLPLLIQFPILIGLYNALYRLAGLGELVDQRFFWIPDLSFPDATVGTAWLTQAWQAKDWTLLISYLILPILLVVTQLVVQKMTQTTSAGSDDPQQGMMKQMMLIMPIMFGWITLGVPSGLALYWVASNLLSLIQQYFTLRGVHPAAEAPKIEAKVRKAEIEAPAVAGDNLALIKGVGDKTASVLAAAGIATFTDLASADETQLANVIDAADLPSGNYAYWIKQAARHDPGSA